MRSTSMSNTDGARVGSRSWASPLCMPVTLPGGLFQVGQRLVDQPPLLRSVETDPESLGGRLRRQVGGQRPDLLERLVRLDLDLAMQPVALALEVGLGLGHLLLAQGCRVALGLFDDG